MKIYPRPKRDLSINEEFDYKLKENSIFYDENIFEYVLFNNKEQVIFKGSLDYEAVSADLLKVSKTKKTELLFLALFLRILKTGGRCASFWVSSTW